MRPDYEDMRDFQYAEENPGYQREVAFSPEPDDDFQDPEIMEMVADTYARDNQRRRESNLQTENTRLRELLEENGVEIPDGS